MAKKPSKTEVVPTVTSPEVPKGQIIRAFGIEKKGGLWVMNVYEIQDNKILSTKASEADNKALALERFKIQFAETYFFGK